MIEKIKKVWNKHNNIAVITIIILMLVGWCLDSYIGETDELWNYLNICKMLDGYNIYTDANVITTPLFFFIGYLILKFVGTNLFVFRLYNLAIMTTLYFFIYLIMKKICKNNFRGFLYFLFIFTETFKLCTGGANYTPLAIVGVMSGIYYNLKYLENKKNNNIIQAIIMFAVFMTKQNIGVYYIVGIALFQTIIDKKNIKNILKQFFILIMEVCIVALIFIYKGIFGDFINMAVLGLQEFARKNFSGNMFDIFTLILWAISGIGITIFLVKNPKIKKEEKEILILLICITVPMFFIKYPIFNEFHKLISNVIISMFILYMLDICILKFYLNKYNVIKIFTVIAIIIYLLISYAYLINWYHNITDNYKFNYSDYYFGGFFTEEEAKRFENITNYIKQQEKRVILFSSKAAIYIIPLELNNKAMDLPLFRKYGEKRRRINA